jgi:hypothetical protein
VGYFLFAAKILSTIAREEHRRRFRREEEAGSDRKALTLTRRIGTGPIRVEFGHCHVCDKS